MLEQATELGLERNEIAAADAPVRAALRLLVVDDDNLHRMIICRAAGKAGYLPTAAASYDEAAQLSQENVFDCISLDLSLGDHAGVEMLRHLWVIGCKAPIIIISGCDNAIFSETAKVAESLKLNVWQTIAKPVNLAVLRDSLERLRASRDEASDSPQQAA